MQFCKIYKVGKTRRIQRKASIFRNSKMADGGSSSSDESLDLSSKKFDPRRALYSPKFQIPVPSAAIYDNLSKYESVIKGKAASSSKVRITWPSCYSRIVDRRSYIVFHSISVERKIGARRQRGCPETQVFVSSGWVFLDSIIFLGSDLCQNGSSFEHEGLGG